MKKFCQLYLSTKFQAYILKNDRVWCLEGGKRPFFTLFHAISVFPYFQNVSDLGRSKSILGSFFAYFEEKLTPKHVSRRPNPNFSV